MKIITFGTFDMFHIGHLNILERAKEQGDRLIVGVSSDALNFSKKSRNPICDEDARMRIVSALKCVDEVFLEESLALKAEYIQRYQADCLIMGDDWAGKFDHFSDLCKVIYLPRTPAISTTQLIEVVKEIK
ncbi:adenylyltransferase/cytidyltransferase family protein [Shewanella sp. 6_MG-2023]|uniref:adenylyltransferase/cytidyltransferase family protein n=1 Tax=Shewanella sp. 6_MG-2023 TaxID=3062660 RepID=UPI0026E3E0AB|nr:adenylyltransferase/cytidyltransferase family protein [Shewanella sp. 6_MG-2023]MDO6619993.1 adenylyltransferase/cytidyltransferase family protein [Shewanella sp. 6_MG-2023]